MWNFIVRFLATGAGVGYSPKAPGTCGTIVGMILAWAISPLYSWSYPITVLTIVAYILLSVWIADQAALVWAAEHGKDPQRIVIDEMVAIAITMFAQPWTWQTVIVGFVAFRFFDIWKPWPIRAVEKLPGGWGIVMDDVLAGICAWIVLRGFVMLIA